MSERRWWHAWSLVREDCGDVHQLTVIGPAEKGPETAETLGLDAWGRYVGSWDHEPSDAEKDAVTPEEYRHEDDEEPR